MKYRIILEENGNGKHYEVQFYTRCWFGYKWVNTTKYLYDCHFDKYYSTVKYDTLEEARHDVNARAIMRTVAEHGVIYERDETCST